MPILFRDIAKDVTFFGNFKSPLNKPYRPLPRQYISGVNINKATWISKRKKHPTPKTSGTARTTAVKTVVAQHEDEPAYMAGKKPAFWANYGVPGSYDRARFREIVTFG
jgi:hypothetical protein